MIDRSRVTVAAFDIDGTIYPNAAMYRASARFIFRHMRLYRAFGAARQEIRALQAADPSADWDAQRLATTTHELVAAQIRRPVEEVREMIARIVYAEWEETLRSVKLFPGLEELVALLRARDIVTVAMSDFPVATKLAMMNVAHLFDHAFSSEETGYLKPAPQPFRRICEITGVEADRVMYVGNSYPYDVLGAASVGMQTVHIARRPVRGSVAGLTVPDIRVFARAMVAE